MLLEMATGWRETPARIATGGTTVSTWRTNIDAALASRADAPTYVLWNLGANDVLSMPTEANFKSNAQYIIDAFRTKWPAVKIYIMQIWERGQAANCATLNGWYSDLVALNPGACFAGPNEGVFLEGGDDGATYTADGTHPNHAGYIATASAWQAVIWPA